MTTPADSPTRRDKDASDAVPSSTNPGEAESPQTLPTAGAPPVPNAWVATPLPGFDIVRELGRGGMGVVYQVFDPKRQKMVALKTMQGIDSRSLLRFKQEFRSLAGLSHPNLVTLYELTGDGMHWFFTMELIDGVSFLRYVHGSKDDSSPRRSRRTPLRSEQEERLRDALRQLASGIHFLHDSGKLHRDIKPGNVLVTTTGRTVLLDFGLAAEMDREQRHCSAHFLGTVAYVSPEQATRQSVTPASDWYSFGVMLYEALTGALPFDGETHDILHNKQRLDPPPPAAVTPGTSDDLSILCMELLNRDPSTRPPGREILRRLSARSDATLQTPRAAPRLEVPLIGRQAHLSLLTEGFEETRRGQTVLVEMQGRSGAGKSALVRHFLERLKEQPDVVALSGRCYEQESVPYKALDSVVDALSRYLESLPDLEAQAFCPRDLSALARVFPVLRRLDSGGSGTRRLVALSDPREVRRRALTALRELLARLGDRRALVLVIDDLQWGDEDSAALLMDLLRPPDAPQLFLLLCYRSEERESSPCLRALRKIHEWDGLDRREMSVEPLAPEERRELALALLDPRDASAAARADSIARQSGGYPIFVYELVRYLQSDAARASDSGKDVSLSEVLWSRILALPEEARRLLEVVAVASRPLAPEVACRAAEVQDERTLVALLRSGRLLRGTGPGERGEVETYHDRIRETVLLYLDPATLQRHHRRLVAVLEAVGGVDPEALAVHLVGSGESARAAQYYALAAAQATEALAFDRAAKLYQLALELQTPPLEDQRPLRIKLADALASAGRGAESARAYLAAATDADGDLMLELQRRAAFQFLRCGHIDDGLATLRTVLSAVGLPLPSTPRRALWGLIYQRLRLRLRGLRYRLRAESEIALAERNRLDVCQSAAIGLSVVDTLQGAYFQTRGSLLALQAGEPRRLVTALTMEAAHESAVGIRARRRTERYWRLAEELAPQTDTPYASAMTALSRGIAASLAGAWREGRRLCDEAEQTFRDSCTGALWERGTAHRFALWPLMFLGDVVEIDRRLPLLLKEARERDDLYEETNLSLVIRTFVRLAADEPERARSELADVMAKWTHEGFHVQHVNHLLDASQIDLYQGDAASAWQRWREAWPALKRSHLLHVQQVRIVIVDQRARCALALAQGGDREKWLRLAARDAHALRREKRPWSDGLARLLEAGIAFCRGDKPRAETSLKAALGAFTASDMLLHAAVAGRRLGQLCGDAEGQEESRLAEEWMRGQTIRNVERMTALLAPGWDEELQ